MKIKADNVGYRELSRIADFIREIEKGNEKFNNLINDYDVTISYDLKSDEVALLCYSDIKICGVNIGYTFYPEELDIII